MQNDYSFGNTHYNPIYYRGVIRVAGKAKRMIDSIIEQRAKGDHLVAEMTKTKMIMKGINPDKYDENSPDDEAIITKLDNMANELGIKL